MDLDTYLNSLGADKKEGTGVFTVAAERARELLSERTLEDPWQAWLCLFQGFYRLSASELAVDIGKTRVTITAGGWSTPKTLREVTKDDRFLLGWLNLDWFGKPQWEPESSRLILQWKGAVWNRYRTAGVLRSLIKSALCYSSMEVLLEGRPVNSKALPAANKFTAFLSARAEGLTFDTTHLTAEQLKEHSLDDDTPGTNLAALAYRSRKSWSQARWLHHGVLIKEERNTLERPGLFVVASVETVGLGTDLSGFNIVHDDRYLRFANRVKKEVLWML